MTKGRGVATRRSTTPASTKSVLAGDPSRAALPSHLRRAKWIEKQVPRRLTPPRDDTPEETAGRAQDRLPASPIPPFPKRRERMGHPGLHDALQGRGVRCWRDEKQMLPGDDIYEQLDRGIRLWDKVLRCCSRHSNQTGAGRGRTIPPFRQRQTKGWGTRQESLATIDEKHCFARWPSAERNESSSFAFPAMNRWA